MSAGYNSDFEISETHGEIEHTRAWSDYFYWRYLHGSTGRQTIFQSRPNNDVPFRFTSGGPVKLLLKKAGKPDERLDVYPGTVYRNFGWAAYLYKEDQAISCQGVFEYVRPQDAPAITAQNYLQWAFNGADVNLPMALQEPTYVRIGIDSWLGVTNFQLEGSGAEPSVATGGPAQGTGTPTFAAAYGCDVWCRGIRISGAENPLTTGAHGRYWLPE